MLTFHQTVINMCVVFTLNCLVFPYTERSVCACVCVCVCVCMCVCVCVIKQYRLCCVYLLSFNSKHVCVYLELFSFPKNRTKCVCVGWFSLNSNTCVLCLVFRYKAGGRHVVVL